MVAVGSYYAGANIIHFDGSYGGTGAAPDIAKKNIAMPIEYAIPKVHRFLVAEGVRDEMCFMASGGIRNAMDVAKAIALGADGAVIGTADLVALECVRCSNCESGRGCARSIATTDPELGLGNLRGIHRTAAGEHVFRLAQAVVRAPASVRHAQYKGTGWPFRPPGEHGLPGRRGTAGIPADPEEEIDPVKVETDAEFERNGG